MAEHLSRNINQIFSQPAIPEKWEALFEERLSNLPAGLKSQRTEAWKLARRSDFPTRKDESWRWMDYSELPLADLEIRGKDSLGLQFQLVPTAMDAAPRNWKNLPEGVLVTSVKGLLSRQPELVEKAFSRSRIALEGKFAQLASALAGDGLFVYIPKNTALEDVIQVRLNLDMDRKAVWTHSIIWIEANTQAAIELDWMSANSGGQGLHNGALEVFLGEGAHLHLDERQHFSAADWNISHADVNLEADAGLEWNLAVFGAKSSKNFVKVDLKGKGSDAKLKGVMFPERGQVVNLDTRQNHWDVSTSSDLIYKSVAANQGKSIWHGMIYVDPKAQQTDAYQSNKNLILDDSAEVKTNPGLEILADDVKCSHGATVGRIDDTELFYLQARGIPENEAQKLIVEGFYNQVLESFRLESTRESLREMLVEKMEEL